MNIYDVYDIDHELHSIASENDGVIPDDLYKAFVEKKLKAADELEKLASWIKESEMFQQSCADEIKRIREKADASKKRVEKIKEYMTPYVKQYGPLTAGTFKLSTRLSKGVVIEDGFSNINFMREKIVHEPDKPLIKAALDSGTIIDGASIVEKDNLQVK